MSECKYSKWKVNGGEIKDNKRHNLFVIYDWALEKFFYEILFMRSSGCAAGKSFNCE